ncbi:unnamed protein product [Mesocestoides corti]|uniref:Cyclin-like domain-containing protein n=1 Tax=Mesocestoides corti TaxID=53468 RepID=A0A0R3UH11_MESCO|nr:unnamed protein product [Mesocestoides corti]
MGNSLVCCRLSWTSFTNSEEEIVPNADYQSRFEFTNHGACYPHIVTSIQPYTLPRDDNYQRLLSYCQKALQACALDASVQHISEREPEDRDPLIECQSDQSPSLTSTYDMENECIVSPEIYKEVYEIYDERVHPLFPASSYCQASLQLPPDVSSFSGLRFQHQILYFLNRLFSSSLVTAESAIVALVYLERIISGLELHVVAWSWRRQLLACILIACKVLDDQAVWNADYCQLLKDVHVEDLNDLERHTLSLLQFNTGVPPAVYARYYFDLLTLGDLVALTDVFSRPARRRMTPKLARRFRILPPTGDVRTEQCSSGIGAAGGGGVLFDLPCLPEDTKGNHLHKSVTCPRRPMETMDANHLPPGMKSKIHQVRDPSESDYERSPSAPSLSSSASSHSSTFTATSGCFQLSPASSTGVYTPWTRPGAIHCDGRGASNSLILLQQDSGLY